MICIVSICMWNIWSLDKIVFFYLRKFIVWNHCLSKIIEAWFKLTAFFNLETNCKWYDNLCENPFRAHST